jgi:hypothetical protein
MIHMATFAPRRRIDHGDDQRCTAQRWRAAGRPDLAHQGLGKTWATERTGFAREVVEAALAHVEGDKVEAANQRGAWRPPCEAPRRAVAFRPAMPHRRNVSPRGLRPVTTTGLQG